jgi:hypothetical protein
LDLLILEDGTDNFPKRRYKTTTLRRVIPEDTADLTCIAAETGNHAKVLFFGVKGDSNLLPSYG